MISILISLFCLWYAAICNIAIDDNQIKMAVSALALEIAAEVWACIIISMKG